MKNVTVSCSYLMNTTDEGLFVIFYSGHEFYYFHGNRNQTENFTSFEVPRLPTGLYRVAVYDLSKNGGPGPKPAAMPMDDILISNIAGQPQAQQDNSLLKFHNVTTPLVSSRRKICLSCTFPSEQDGCVGIFHKSQFENITLAAVLVVRGSGGINCTEDGVKVGDYHYAVFGLRAAHLSKYSVYRGNFQRN